jgi:hypothetical protein
MSLMRIPAAVAICVATALGLTLGATTGAAAAGSGTRLTHAQAVKQLDAAGITWNASGNCTERTRAVCTSFSGVRQSTIDGVRTLRSSSRCPIVVTGGTETGHATGTYSHWNGWKIDIRRNACIDAYVAKWFKPIGEVAGWGVQYRARSGNLYTNEGHHWDILFYTCGCARA